MFVCLICMVSAYSQNTPSLIHPELGTSIITYDGMLSVKLIDRKQNYNWSEASTLDKDVISPKSINIAPSGTKFYVNSLEGATTVVYDAVSRGKLKVINHRFTASDAGKWTAPSTFYKFNHEYKSPNSFYGKPVESAFSHGGRYLWIPYYRRSFDLNAQDPSAVAIVDTHCDSIIQVMEAGVLPKMVTASPDGKWVAIAHWGDNTVGIIDVASDDPRKWHHESLAVVDRQLKWDLSMTEPVNRDVNSGNCLRGMAFTPDSRYLLVGCMGGMGGIAVIDMQSCRYLGKIYGMMPNLRHLIIKNGYLYVSINKAGYIQRAPMSAIYEAIAGISSGKSLIRKWDNCKVGAGARTIEATPDGNYIFVACNFASKLMIVDARSMKPVGSIDVDSFPVGLDVSEDGRFVYVTSQGRKGRMPSGNCVDVYEISYLK